MDPLLRITLWAMALGFVALSVWLVARHHVSEGHTLVWLGAALGIVFLVADPGMWNAIAYRLGVSYPPSLLFLLAILVLLLVTLYQSIHLSKLRAQIQQLTQTVALLPYTINENLRETSLDTTNIPGDDAVFSHPMEKTATSQDGYR